jgi:redox-sensitive bicupin YhaK (pirin superfamily)
MTADRPMPRHPILRFLPLGMPWPTVDPFLFCVHHRDAYPRANEAMGPDASLAGRALGQDFSGRDGWSMYHGTVVPGFPAHPHRGFETVTVVRRGLIDHSDSLGAAARFGRGDVQWLTAGRGIVHAEMFPLLDRTGDNPAELFQIWLNLPAARKMAAPYFTMFWAGDVPRAISVDARSRRTELTLVTGHLPACCGEGPAVPPPPPPSSWAADPDADVAIATLRMAPGATWTLPAARSDATRRVLYFFAGRSVEIAGTMLREHAAIEIAAGTDVALVNADEPAEFLLLQGRPLGEPVAHHGPFVMNTRAEIVQAMDDYRRTQFGGWPWPDAAPVHGRDPARFARHPDGRVERPPAPAPAEGGRP